MCLAELRDPFLQSSRRVKLKNVPIFDFQKVKFHTIIFENFILTFMNITGGEGGRVSIQRDFSFKINISLSKTSICKVRILSCLTSCATSECSLHTYIYISSSKPSVIIMCVIFFNNIKNTFFCYANISQPFR